MNIHHGPLDGLPSCLADLLPESRWVGWRWETRDGKRTKPPFRASGGYAHNDKPETWSTAADIARAARSRGFEGLGLELLGIEGFAAIDLDKVRDPDTGEALPWAEEVIRWGAYAEVTPSGTGFRVLGRVDPGHCSIHRKWRHPGGGEVEVYVHIEKGRYITVTGSRVAGTPDELLAVDDLIAIILSDVDADVGGAAGFNFGPGEAKGADLGALPQWLRDTISHGRSGDRSADFQAAVNGLRARVDFDTALRLLREHPGGPGGKYGARLEDELRRSWAKAEASANGYARNRASAGMDGASGGAAAAPADAGDLDLSHDALACDLGARSWDDNARHVAGWDRWLFWDQTRWVQDDALSAMTRGRGYLRTRADEVTAWAERKAEGADEREAAKLEAWAKGEARTLRHASTVAAVVSLARSNLASVARPDDFDADLWLLGTPGGTVDLRTGGLRPARREDAITRQAAVAPATGRPERWLAFLDEVMGGDPELIAFLQRAAGYSLTGETREHKMLFAYGTGRNGKSTFLEALLHLWGDYARRVPATSLLNSQGEKHPTDLAGLRGARLAVGSELARGKSWDESAIKDMTGGDVLTARFMRQDFFDFRPQFTLWIAGNTMPSFRGVDEALRSRVVLVPFTVTIPAERRDPELPARLREEAGQIMAWCIEGAVAWQRQGLAVPTSVAAASRDYLDGEDTLGQFLADETVEDRAAFTTSTDLHLRFRQWSERQGLTAPWSVNTFSKELRSRGFTDDRRKHGRGFLGIRLA